MRLGGSRSAGGVARLVVAVAIVGLVGGCQTVGTAYESTVRGVQNAYESAYRIAYARLYTRLFGATRPTPQQLALLQRLPLPATPPIEADRIVVFKHARLLELVRGGEVFETFPIALGPDAEGPKQRQGDGRTPEGRYTIDWESLDTKYTGELHISYPDAADRARAAAMGVDPGGAIFVHGMPLDFGPYDPPVWYRDWTEGCIAVGNLAIVKIMSAVPVGTPIDILP
jgi:murein L,D-transpeptidase YafK